VHLPAASAPPPYSNFEFEQRGSDSVVLKINGTEAWTGANVGDQQLATVLQSELVNVFLLHFRDRSMKR
jgi:hypothetical protein